MTIVTTSNQARFLGNGATTVFPFAFLIPNAADLFVYYTDPSGVTSLIPSSAYTVSGLGLDAGGAVTYNPGSPIPAGSILVVQRRLPYTQTTDLVNQDGFYPQVVEDAMDSLEMQIQQLVQDQSLNLHVDVTDTPPGSIPAAAQRANKFLAFDGTGAATAALSVTGAAVSTPMIPVISASTLAIARAALGLGAGATLGVGPGLRNDGTNLSVNSAIVNVNSATAINAAADMNHYAVTGAMTFTAVKANTLFNGFAFWVEATGGDATFAIDPSDTVVGSIGSGVSWTIPQGMSAFVKTDGVSSWYIEMMGMASVKTVTGTYNITAADNYKFINHLSGAFGTIIFPAAATLPANFQCWIQNGDSARGKGVGGTNMGSFTMWPAQGYLVRSVNGQMQLVGGLRRWKLPQDTTWEVSPSSGSDNPLVSDGLVTGAFATPQYGIDTVCNFIDINRKNVVVHLADGTYNTGLHLYDVTGWGTIGGHSELCIRGNLATPANCLIAVSNSNCFSMVGLTTPWRIEGFIMTASGSPGNCVSCDGGSFVYIGNNIFSNCSNAHMSCSYFSFLEVIANYTINGGAAYHWNAFTDSLIDTDTATVNIPGTIAITTFAAAFVKSTIEAQSMTFTGAGAGSGTAGVRYTASLNSVINTGGGGAAYLPGNVVGTVASGGQYG